MKSIKAKQLLVEGNDDFYVISTLCERYNITENFKIIDCKGIDELLNGIPVRLKSSSDALNTIGIIIDADSTENAINTQWKKLGCVKELMML